MPFTTSPGWIFRVGTPLAGASVQVVEQFSPSSVQQYWSLPSSPIAEEEYVIVAESSSRPARDGTIPLAASHAARFVAAPSALLNKTGVVLPEIDAAPPAPAGPQGFFQEAATQGVVPVWSMAVVNPRT